MNSLEIATKIRNELNSKGAELGNISDIFITGIIESELRKAETRGKIIVVDGLVNILQEWKKVYKQELNNEQK